MWEKIMACNIILVLVILLTPLCDNGHCLVVWIKNSNWSNAKGGWFLIYWSSSTSSASATIDGAVFDFRIANNCLKILGDIYFDKKIFDIIFNEDMHHRWRKNGCMTFRGTKIHVFRGNKISGNGWGILARFVGEIIFFDEKRSFSLRRFLYKILSTYPKNNWRFGLCCWRTTMATGGCSWGYGFFLG